MGRVRSPVLALSTGYVLMYFSELMFWARPRPGDTPGNWAATWLAYSLLGYIFLIAVRHFRVRSLEALFVAGALVGWLGEGVLVHTLYDAFPLQISWTGLAWHSLISVCLGWYGLRRALAAPRFGLGAVWCLGLGVFWGLWSIFWRAEEPQIEVGVLSFAAFSCLATTLLGGSLWAYERCDPRAFHPSRLSAGLAIGAMAAVFVAGTVPAVPMAVLVLPLLVGLLAAALGRNRMSEGAEGDTLAAPVLENVPRGRLLLLAIIPVSATLIHGAAIAFDLRWQTNWAVYLLTMPAGFVLFGAACIRLIRRKPSSASSGSASVLETRG